MPQRQAMIPLGLRNIQMLFRSPRRTRRSCANPRNVAFGSGSSAQPGISMYKETPKRLTAIGAASESCRFLARQFPDVLRVLLVPLTATAVVGYLSLWVFLSEAIDFVTTRDVRANSIALGA